MVIFNSIFLHGILKSTILNKIYHFGKLFKELEHENIRDMASILAMLWKLLDYDENNDLFQSMTTNELRGVIHSGRNENPRRDDYTTKVFTNFFVVREDQHQVMEHIREIGHMPRIFNSSFITLISLVSKVNYPNNFNDFWLISFCNSLYKIITKVKEIITRLKPLLSRVILLQQFGFLR